MTEDYTTDAGMRIADGMTTTEIAAAYSAGCAFNDEHLRPAVVRLLAWHEEFMHLNEDICIEFKESSIPLDVYMTRMGALFTAHSSDDEYPDYAVEATYKLDDWLAKNRSRKSGKAN